LGASLFELLTKYYSDDQIQKNEIVGECGTYSRKGEMCTGFWWGNRRERNHLEDLGVEGKIILKLFFSK
jgi:hypothetical protein